jgi:hypothetical protein
MCCQEPKHDFAADTKLRGTTGVSGTPQDRPCRQHTERALGRVQENPFHIDPDSSRTR